MTAFETLIAHCNESHPHMDSPRGQIDIAKAKAEYSALSAIAVHLETLLKNIGTEQGAFVEITDRLNAPAKAKIDSLVAIGYEKLAKLRS